MKEYIIKEIKPNRYRYGYRIQKFDIKLMLDLGLQIPSRMIEKYKNTQNENEFIYFYDSLSVEFLKRQYYIRDYIEFAGMNVFELNLLIENYNQRMEKVRKIIDELVIHKLTKEDESIIKETLNELSMDLFILENDLIGIKCLRDKTEKEENRKSRM